MNHLMCVIGRMLIKSMIKNMIDNQGNERRRYFRVSDLVGIKYRLLSEGERDLATQEKPTSLKSLLGQIEEQITINLASIQNSQPEVHQLLDLFNQKINLAFGHGFAEGAEDEVAQSTRACQVNLSACGIAFPCSEQAALNQYLSIEVTLYPDNACLNLLAAVISCDRFDDGSGEHEYLLRANFVNIGDADQEILVQHVIQRQVHQLKDRRSEAEH